MKKIYSLLACLICCIVSIQAQKPFYIHQNDGSINVFYTDMVDSITTTVEAQGGGKYLSYQKIWTADSVFTFDVSRIDSISYVTPATKYKPDVTKLEEGMLDYIIGCDSLTLKLKADTPNKFIPAVEDKLVCLEMTDILPNGFAGEVVNVEKKSDAVYVECKLIPLTDIFDCYYGVHSSDAEDNQKLINNTQTRVEIEGIGIWNPSQPIKYSLDMPSGDGEKGAFAWEYATDASVTLDPLLIIRTVIIVSKETGTQVSLTLNGEHRVDCNFSYTGSLNFDKKLFAKPLYVPLGQPLIRAYVQTGPFLRASLGTSINAHLGLTYGTNLSWNWSTREDVSSQNTFNPIYLVGKECTAEGMVSGTLQTGVGLDLGLSLLCADLAKVYVGFELGTEINGNGTFMKTDFIDSDKTYTVYDKLLNTNIEGHYYAGWGIGAEAGPGIFEWTHPINSIAIGKPVFDINLAPKFSNLKASFNKTDNYGIDVSSNVSGDCLPLKIGYVVRDKYDGEMSRQYVWDDYRGDRHDECKYTFYGMPRNKPLYVTPIISLMGCEVLARPEKEVRAEPEAETLDVHNITVNSADVIVSFHNVPEEGIEAGMEYYSYSSGTYETTFRIYTDGDRQVSLTGLEEETTYEYAAFVEWKGERIYGESRQFTTKKKEDGPTEGKWIDLGLSVKWASYNVGASSPEGYGSYFAWGETSPKDSYDWDNYAYGYWDEYGCYHGQYLGDISGNSAYDAATANWGAPARMPTLAQCKELVNSCIWQWTTYNGVNGMLVTGPNGNSIFLPAAGGRGGSSLSYAGEYGYFWSSAPGGDNDDYAYNIYFGALGFDWDYWGNRCGGRSVRPVSN